MKKTKRIFAILLSLAMIMTMSIAMSATAFAVDTNDAKVTVTGLDKGDVAHFYKVVEWVGVQADKSDVAGWKAVAPFDTYLTKEKLTQILVGKKAEGTAEAVPPTGITAADAAELAKAATSSVADVDVTASSAELNTTAVEPGKGAGIYMVLVTPADPDTVYGPVFVSSDFKNDNQTNSFGVVEKAATYADNAAAKKSKVTLTKTASADEEDWADKEWKTTAIGEKVDFTVKTTIPGYGKAYDNPMFKVTDNLTDLALVAKSVKVKDIAAENYTITEATDGKSYTVEFKKDYLKTLTVPTDVTITYSAIVTTTAPVHVNTEKNEVSTEFSNNPKNEDDHGFKKDTTQHYTFTIDANGLGGGGQQSGKKTSEIVKVGRDAQGNPIKKETKTSEITSTESWESPLAGAKFKLYTDAAAKNQYVPKKADGTADTAKEYITEADGRMTIAGLDAGTYYLQESEAPSGFITDPTIHEIKITAETEEVEVTEYTKDGQTWLKKADYDKLTDKTGYKAYTYKTDVLKTYTVKIDGQATATYHFKNEGTDAEIIWTETPPVEKPSQIINVQGVELPSTGGIGTIIFYTLGTILVIGCGIVLISRRRLLKNR